MRTSFIPSCRACDWDMCADCTNRSVAYRPESPVSRLFDARVSNACLMDPSHAPDSFSPCMIAVQCVNDRLTILAKQARRSVQAAFVPRARLREELPHAHAADAADAKGPTAFSPVHCTYFW